MSDSHVSRAARGDMLAIAFALSFPSLITWIYFIYLAQAPAAAQQVAMGMGKIIQFVFPLLWALAIRRERISVRHYGTSGIDQDQQAEGQPLADPHAGRQPRLAQAGRVFGRRQRDHLPEVDRPGSRQPGGVHRLGGVLLAGPLFPGGVLLAMVRLRPTAAAYSRARGNPHLQFGVYGSSRAGAGFLFRLAVGADGLLLPGGGRRRRLLGLALPA